MKAEVGDRIVVEAEKVGQSARSGVVEEVLVPGLSISPSLNVAAVRLSRERAPPQATRAEQTPGRPSDPPSQSCEGQCSESDQDDGDDHDPEQ